MLFNKHAETKQRFGIRKLTIGATSVLLSTLFLTVNNGQKVHAATDETVTNADNKSGTEDKAVTTENSETEDKAQEATNVTKKTNEDKTATTEEKQTGAVAKTSEKVGDNATTDKSSETQASEDKVSSDDKTTDVANTELLRQLTIKKSLLLLTRLKKNNVTTPTSEVAKPAVNNKLAAPAPAPSTASLSDDGLVATDDQGVTLSMSKKTLGEGGQLGNSGITVKFSGSVSAGDIYTIQVPDFGWGYGWGQYGPINDSTITTAGALGNFATAKKTNVVIDGQNYANYQITFKQGITIDSKGFQIVLNNGNNYYGQGRPSTTIKDGKYYQNIYWSRSSQADPTKITKNPTLSFIRKVETGFNKPTFNLTAPDRNKVSALAPDTDYQFTLNINQGTGLNGLTDHTAAQINSARNYGSVITIPVPKGFVLNQDVSLKNSQIEDETTIEQVGGAGGNIIITVPKGSGRQNYEGKPGYVIVGRFINHPETTSTFTAADNITVTEQVLTKDGKKEIKAVLPPWQITLKGAKDKPSEGEFGVQAWGNNNGNIFTQTVPTKIANYFNFTNNTALAYENNLHLTFDFDDGLAINALSTPKINDVDRYGTRSYTYTLTLTDGTKVTGTIDAGGKIDVPTKTMTITAKSHDKDGKEEFKDIVVPVTIKSADLVPNFWAAGAHGDNILNYRTGGNFGTNQLISDETFMAYGYISDVLNNDLHLPKDTKVKSTLTVSSPAYRPDTKFYATDTQTVMSKDSIKSALWASGKQDANNRYYSPEIDYTKEKYGSISINVSNDSKKASNRIVEPTFYYVLPAYTNFTGDLTNLLNLNPGITDGDKSKENIKPKLTSYMVGNQQVIKLDYSGTGFVYDANKDGNTLPIAIDADAEPGVYKWNVYLFTQTGIVNHDAITNTSDVANKYTQNVVQEAEKAGKSGSLYMIGDGNWEIKTPPVAYAPNTVQGNLDVKSVANGKSDDKGSEEMNYATEIANYSSGSIKDPYMLINFPQADPKNKNSFTFELTGPEEFIALNNNLGKDDFTTYYSTKTQDLPTVKDRGKVPDMTGYVTAGQVTDWSKIKSAVIKFNTTLPGGTVLGQIVFKGKDSTLKTDAGKTSYFRAAVMGETINPFLTENTSIKVVGKSTVNTRLHYQDTDRQDHYINVPTMTKEYNDNVDPMNSSDFDLNSIPKELIPDHYELVANQTPSIINNEDGNSKDATAEFNKTVTYAFDGDTVQFELTPKIDKATQSIKHVVHFVTDDSSAHQLFDDQAVDVTVTQATNEVTGQKTYAASYMENGKEVDLLVTKLDDGQISITFPAATIPSSKGYYVVDNTKDQANALTHIFTFTANSNPTIENTVKYAPDHQELKIRVHDDTTNQDLSPVTAQSDLIKEHGTTVAISADGHTDEATPADFSNNIDELKKYYESKGYKIVSTSEVPTKFDNTSNGDSLTDKTPQYVDIHLEHALKLEKESKEVTRTINFYDQDQNKLIHDANPNLPQYPQTVTQVVKFDRYIVRDQVTSQIIGYATPSQVTVDDTGQAQLVQKDGYTHATDATAGFTTLPSYDKYNSYSSYDLSKYGYDAATDKDGSPLTEVKAETPKPTDSNSVVNVYYREKVLTVTVDNPPTPGTPVTPGSDIKYPQNNWDEKTATSESTRTIHYIYDNNTSVNGKDVSGQPVPGLHDIKQTVTYAQSATINLVTGEVSYQGDWKPYSSSTTNQNGEVTTTKDSNSSNSYAKVVSPNYKTNPSLTGYTPHQGVVNAAKATHGANASDVFVRYVANNSLVQVEYVDKDTGDTLKVDKKTGKSGETFTYSTADLIKEYEKQGYELVHDGYTANDGDLNQSTFDSYDVPDGQYPTEIKQKWTISLKHKKITVTSDQPKDSTEKITTPDGYDHNYPSGVSQSDLNNTVKRTISFIYTDKPAGHNQVFPSVEQDVSYKRDATIDLVKLGKGEKDAVTYSNWEPAEAGKESFDKNEVKVVPGYIADYEVVPSQDILKDENGKAKDGQNVVVKYSPVGKIIPVDKNGTPIPNASTPSYNYNNDPKDPTRITNTPVPEIPGYHAEISEVTPDKSGENTKVVYVKNKQSIDLVYVDTTTNRTLTTQVNVAQGDSDSAIPASVTDTLKATEQSYLDKGYVVDDSKTPATVPANFDSSRQNPDGTDAEHQIVTVYLKHGKETITGDDPKDPRDPINEKDPNGAKYPPEASKSNLAISSQNIVHYKGAGEQTPKDSVVTYDNTLTRTVTIDKVTGKVLETSAWQGEKDYDDVATLVVNGYFADKKAAGESKVTTADVERAKDGVITNETTVVYKPMGKIIPVDKNGNPIPNSPRPIFNNDPQDPTKASKTNTPEIPGYHTEISEVTPDPDNPDKDREVVYVADSQKVLIQVYDKDSKTPNQPLDTSKTNVTVSFNGDSFTNFPTSAATSVDDLIKYYESCGYKVENKPTAEELAAKFDGDKTVDQYLKLTLVHDTETITGENPKKVGDPINPADPDSKKYGEQTSKENLVIASEVTIDYDGAGKKTPTKSVRTNDRALTRSVTIDKVTGAVISTSDWTGGANYDAVTTPKIPGYTADLESAGKASITPADYNDAVNGVITRKFKVVYTPEKQELQLKVYDQDLDKYLGGTDSFYGLTDQEVGEDPQTRLDELKKQFAEWGFDIVEVPELAKNYDNTENGTSDQDNKPQVFVLVVKHHIETVTPDDPKTPDDKIPNTNQNYPGGLTETDLSKTITRTIIVHMPDGSTKEIKQEVVYTRTATVDSVTKEVTYTDWTSKNSNWSEYQSPDIPGYTVDIEKVELAKVPVDGHDVTVEINYTADPVPDEPVNPSNPGNPGTTMPDQPQQPGKPTDPTKPSEPNKPSKPGRPTNPNRPTKPTKPVTPAKPDQTHDQYSKVNGETDLNGFVDGISDEKAGAVAGASDNAQAGAKKLPQTSGESGWQASLLGMGLFFISLFGFKKKKEDE